MTEQEQNERMALLLGWKCGHPGISLGADNPERILTPGSPPDYSMWGQFEEMRSFVRSLSLAEMVAIEKAMFLGGTNIWAWLDITPSMLRDAILQVVGEEAEVGL